jgi:cysteine-rich repeat protein
MSWKTVEMFGVDPTTGDKCGDGRRNNTIPAYWDDKNLEDGDGCSSTWSIENGYICSGGSLFQKDTWIEICGDGKRFNSNSSYWDDENTESGDGCSDTCGVEAGWNCQGGTQFQRDTWTEVCGDGIRHSTNKNLWDDGNNKDGDGCSHDCMIEDGYQCSHKSPLAPDKCVPIIGDSKIVGNEKWDDGNKNDKDGCSSNGQIEKGWKWFKASENAKSKCKRDYGTLELPFGEASMPTTSEMTTTTKTAVITAAGMSIGFSATSSSATTSLWAIINQLQLLMLLILIKGYVNKNTREYLVGQKFVLVTFDILGTSSEENKLKFFGEPQKDEDLKDIGLEKISTLANILSILLLVFLVAIIHFILKKVRWGVGKFNNHPLLRVYVWIREKLMYFFKYIFYLRLVLQCHESFILSSMSEIKHFIFHPDSSPWKIVSLLLAILVFWSCLFLIFLSIRSYNSVKNKEKLVDENDDESIYNAFYPDLKENKLARLYTSFLLIRRTLFWTIVIIFLKEENEKINIFCCLLIIQVVYLTQFVIIRPFVKFKQNLIELINEGFILIYLCVFFAIGDDDNEEGWKANIANLVLLSMVSNTIILVIIEISTFKILLYSWRHR